MINLQQIFEQYPDYLRGHKESILKEYLQCKILYIIFESKHANKLSFLGGTSLRILYNNARFSEDLDFDSFGINLDEITILGKIIKESLEKEGFKVAVEIKNNNNFRIKIRIPELLFDLNMSPFFNQKILIQVDIAPKMFDYVPDEIILNKFEVFTKIQATPKDILLSQKIYTAFNRKRIMGRDFFDIVFLYGVGTMPNFEFLSEKLGIKNNKELRSYLLEKTKEIDFEFLAKDLEPLIFNEKDKNRVTLFKKFVEDNIN
jgi:predicted nucleotidyltransferase component of viral defense system